MILLVGVGLTYVFYTTFYMWSDKVKLLRRKPFNCQFCISFWIALLFFFMTHEYQALLIPITYDFIRRIQARL